MAILIRKGEKTDSLLTSVERISGVSIRECLQCKKCSNGCPVRGLTMTGPSEIIRRLQLDAADEIFKNDLVWMCVSCEICHDRCPMKIDMAAIMDALRILAARSKSPVQTENVQFFNKAFLYTVKLFGRTYDLGMIGAYKIGTSSYLQDTDKFPMMLRKRKIALLPSAKGNKKYIRRIFKAKDKED
jgi:heterodisulfide reductase subunit C